MGMGPRSVLPRGLAALQPCGLAKFVQDEEDQRPVRLQPQGGRVFIPNAQRVLLVVGVLAHLLDLGRVARACGGKVVYRSEQGIDVAEISI